MYRQGYHRDAIGIVDEHSGGIGRMLWTLPQQCADQPRSWRDGSQVLGRARQPQ